MDELFAAVDRLRRNHAEAVETWDDDRSGLLPNRHRATATGEEELRGVLLRWLDDLSTLRDPGVTTAPIY